MTIKVPKVLNVLDVHIHFRDSYRKGVKNIIISRKDMLDMGKCVQCKMDFFILENITIEENKCCQISIN